MTRLAFLALVFFALHGPASAADAPVWDVLSESEKATLAGIQKKWETWVPKLKDEGIAPLMTFKEIYDGMTEEEARFLDRIRKINPHRTFDFQGDYLGSKIPEEGFTAIKDQWIVKNGVREKIHTQFLPGRVFEAYETMMEAMEKDIGKRLLVESGYRSPAYQLYTFLFYLPKHRYSLVETGHYVALPGYSEHGAPQRQAIDFINREGINGEDIPEEFENLPEYKWLMENAARFNFVLSYPRDQKGITFEPWHWSYRPPLQDGSEAGNTQAGS